MINLNSISFDLNFINKVFPFNMIIDDELKIISVGKSLNKLNIATSSKLSNEFEFLRPNSIQFSVESITTFQNQIIVLKSLRNSKFILRGQFVHLKDQQVILFLGGPWIISAEELTELNLIIPDFALHDPITDLIQVVKSKDIVMEDIKKLVSILQEQKINLEKSENELKTTSNRLTVLIQNLQSGILVENEHRKIVLVNQQFCNFFGIPAPPEVLVGIDCSQSAEQSKHLFKDPEGFVKSIDNILKEKKLVMGEELILTSNVILERNYIPIITDNIYQGHLWQYTDITNRKLAESELIEAKENAIKSKKAKEQFMANISHEIRTPINIIGGLTNLLLESNLGEEEREKVEIIKFSSENLLSLVNDILDFEKINSNKLTLEKEPFELIQVISNTVHSMKFLAENKQINLKINIDSNTPPIVIGDQLRFKQILINLINNAIKFTEKGFVKINVESKQHTKEDTTVSITIEDTGIGIKEEDINEIFKRFTQANSNTTRKYGGTGLGLTIVKKLIELHQAKMEIKSQLGLGTTFKLQFPFTIGNLTIPEQIAQKENRTDHLLLTSKKILIVEDNILNQMVLEGVLKKYDPIIYKCEHGKDAVLFLESNEVDLILMDIQMPEMDGYETTTYIRKFIQNNNSKIPIVAITANSVNSEKIKCLEAGMNDLIAKPFKEHELIKTLYTQLNGLSNESPLKYSNLSYLQDFYGSDTEKINAILKQFLIQIPEHLKAMNNYLQLKEWEELARMAHKVKPTLSYVGMDDTKALIIQLEDLAKKKGITDLEEKQLFQLFEKVSNELILAHHELSLHLK